MINVYLNRVILFLGIGGLYWLWIIKMYFFFLLYFYLWFLFDVVKFYECCKLNDFFWFVVIVYFVKYG